jgi:hypothetical protein
MGIRRNVIVEIEAIRNRTGPPDWDNGITKLLFLSEQAKTNETDSEQLGYFIVASIAAMEVYFRWEIRRLIDSGDARYTDNFRFYESLKLSHDLLSAVHGRRVTIGKLAAHSVRLSNLDAISKTMSQLLGTGFLDLVREARNPESRREQGEAASAVISSMAEIVSAINRTFELRHIICHEAHLNTTMKADEVKSLCSSCYDFAVASYYAIAHHDNPAPSLTLQEAYDAARARAVALEKRLREEEERIESGLGDSMARDAFEKMQLSWRAYARQAEEYNACLDMNGSRGAIHGQQVLGYLYKQRIEEIEDIGKTEGRRFRS